MPDVWARRVSEARGAVEYRWGIASQPGLDQSIRCLLCVREVRVYSLVPAAVVVGSGVRGLIGSDERKLRNENLSVLRRINQSVGEEVSVL